MTIGTRFDIILTSKERKRKMTVRHYTVEFDDIPKVHFKYKTFNEMLRVLASITSNNEYFGSREFVEHFTESIEKNNSYAYIWNDKFNIEHCVSVFVKTFDCGNNI